MIYVDGIPLLTDHSSQGIDILNALLAHPTLVAASRELNATPVRKFSVNDGIGAERFTEAKWVYLFQREYATVNPAFVDLIGTDEATTCVGFVIRNRGTGMTSVAHMDSPKVVDAGLSQMLSSVVDQTSDTALDVHLLGGFDDSLTQHVNGYTENREKQDGYSIPLCSKLVETLEKSSKKFQIQTLHVLGHNTRQDSEGHAYPVFNGFLVETSSGSIFPASFDRTSRCPDEIVRRVRVTASFRDPNWTGRLLETYDTQTDRFMIAPCVWTSRELHMALALQNLSDTEILLTCSTSPSAEAPDFVENERRQWDYIIHHPDWRETFPSRRPRVFKRGRDGNWIRQSETGKAV